MTIWHAFWLGIVEGATEFLPISSTFHLLFTSRLMGVEQTEFSKFFDVFIQAGAMLPIILLYFKEWFQSPQTLKKVVVAFLPTGAIGFALHSVIKGVFFESELLMLSMFILLGVLFLLIEWLVAQGKLRLVKSLSEMTYVEAFVVGVVQATAVLPGVSRAGAVIVGMMLLGYRRDEAAKFSFSLAVPTILMAAGYDLLKMNPAALLTQTGDVINVVVGFVMAALSALVVIKWFISYLRGNSLALFSYYRFGAAALLALFLR